MVLRPHPPKESFAESLEKQKTREDNLAFVRKSKLYCFYNGILHGTWLELCGGPEQDESFEYLLSEGVLVPGKSKYIGVSYNPNVISSHQRHYAEHIAAGMAEWICSDWNVVLDNLQQEQQPVHVVNFDSFNSLSNGHLEKHILNPNLHFVREQSARNGACVLIMYFALRGTAQIHTAEGVEHYKQRLGEFLGMPFPDGWVVEYTSKKTPMTVTRFIKKGL